MNIVFINHFCKGFMVTEIPIVSVFGIVRIQLLSPIYIYIYIYIICIIYISYIIWYKIIVYNLNL